MSNLPSKKAQCPRCKSTDLKVIKEVIGEGMYRRVMTSVLCRNCNYKKAV